MAAHLDPTEAHARLREAVEVAFLADEHDLAGPDGQTHAFEIDFDGDGWNEPYSVHATCVCGGWESTWFQTDREQTDRPATADLLMAWLDHYQPTCEHCDGTGWTVQGRTDKNGYSEDQYGPCVTCQRSRT